MAPRLLEVNLTLGFPALTFPEEKLRRFHQQNNVLFFVRKPVNRPAIASMHSMDGSDSALIETRQFHLRSSAGLTFPALKIRWSSVVDSFFNLFDVFSARCASLQYIYEVEIHDLQILRNAGEPVLTAQESIDFFRSEFVDRCDSGELHVRLQPDWNDGSEAYCIQLSLESRSGKAVTRVELPYALDQMDEGLLCAHRQILTADSISFLPQ